MLLNAKFILQTQYPNRCVPLYELQAQKQAADIIEYYPPNTVIKAFRSITIKQDNQLHCVDIWVDTRALRLAQTHKGPRPRRQLGIHEDLKCCCLVTQLCEVLRRLPESSGVNVQASRDFFARTGKSQQIGLVPDAAKG
jgi:hypothetical protein